MIRVAVLVLLGLVTIARADEGEEIGAINARVARGEIDATTGMTELETVGARRPPTIWTDNACFEAAQLAERARDFARTRRDLDCVIAIGLDARLVERARAGLARIAGMAGASGEWDAVAKRHDAMVAAIEAGGDPTSELEALEDLVRNNPTYPRASLAKLFLARHWETEGEDDRAIAWLRDATGERAATELARVLVRHDHDGAAEAIAKIRDPVMRTLLASERDSVVRRRWLHRVAWLVLAIVATVTIVAARRSWRTLLRPPIEAVFIAPIAIVIAVVAQSGNPLVARAVAKICIAGVAVAWISGGFLERHRGDRRAIAICLAATLIASAAIVYLSVDRDSLASMIAETWRAGPEQ